MLKQLSIIAGVAALVAAPIAMLMWPGEMQPGAAQATEASAVAPIQVAVAHPNYDAGMRIIHVPDAGAIAAYPRQSHRELKIDAPAQKARPERIAMPKPPQPRRILPPPTLEPKRTVLSAPPAPANSLTPIRPTPRWRSIEKFTPPPEGKLPAPLEAPLSETSAPAAEAIPPPTPTETAAAPAPAEVPDIDDDSPPPAD